MNEASSQWRRQLQGITALYSFLWLLAANLVGLWLALLLLWPSLGEVLGELTYGRWMPLHMDWHLYGWCSLPLVGLLMAFFLEKAQQVDAHLGYLGWSLALMLGGAMSLSGMASGKLFLNFSGLSRIAFPAAQLLLWAILVAASYARWRRIARMDAKQWCQFGLLILLFISPLSLLWASGASVYPPIDPESGGATGHSLLASTLGIIAIFGVLPRFLRLRQEDGERRWERLYVGLYFGSWCVWAIMDHGNASNTQVGQVLGLFVLLFWVPLVRVYYRSFVWPERLVMWRRAFLFWWAFLTVSGCLSFLPGVLDLMKFTNGLVAHAHLAMAGMLGALNMLILGSLGSAAEKDPWSDRCGYWLWQVGTLLYVFAMLLQGVREGLDPTVLFGANTMTSVLYVVRLFAGFFLISATLRWVFLVDAVRREAEWVLQMNVEEHVYES